MPSALDVQCPECDAPPEESCVVVTNGFAGRGPKRKTNRIRSPHPEREALAGVTKATTYKAKRGDAFITLAWKEPNGSREGNYPMSVVPELLATIFARGVTSIWADPADRARAVAPVGMVVEALY